MIPRITIAPSYEISRVIKGGWQLAGDHGAVDREQAVRDMAIFVDSGITTFDCADIYTGVEELIGQFRRQYPTLAGRTQVHTKFVPNLQSLREVRAAYVEEVIDRSLQRLGAEQLDLVQFHWWDFAVPGYVETALVLESLRRKGKIAHIGLTNFDVQHLVEIVSAGVPVSSHQLQYSLLDNRPEGGMVAACQARQVALLCYGTVAGGFLSDRWLGQPEPTEPPKNRSLIKYKLIIDDFGGWQPFQQLLSVLRAIADRKGCDIATVASRAMLDRSGVAAVIVGAVTSAHVAANARIRHISLEPADHAAINRALAARTGPLGDVFVLERDRHGRHGRIMKYELNA